MKCSDCGKRIANWPAWLNDPSLSVRCLDCAGVGATTINGTTERPLFAAHPETEQTYELAEAA